MSDRKRGTHSNSGCHRYKYITNYQGTFRGYDIYMDDDAELRFCDTEKLTAETWEDRPCGHCLKHNNEDGHDACLGTLPGVVNACCGHGNNAESFIVFEDGSRVSGFSPPLEYVAISFNVSNKVRNYGFHARNQRRKHGTRLPLD